jgi:hypothetical protein
VARRLLPGVSSLADYRVGQLRCPPGVGPETFVSSQTLRVDLLKLETPAFRVRRLRSVTLIRMRTFIGRLRLQPAVGPETFVSGGRLRCSSHLGQRLWPSWLETPALVDQQRLHFVEHYIKPSSTSRRGCGFYSLSSIVAKLQSTRSPILATRT